MLQNQEKIDKNIDQGKFFTNVKQEKKSIRLCLKITQFLKNILEHCETQVSHDNHKGRTTKQGETKKHSNIVLFL